MKKFSQKSQPSAPPGYGGAFGRGTRTGERIATIKNIPGGVMLEVQTPYSEDLYKALTTNIPANQRTWDAQHKVWYIWKKNFDLLTHILSKHCDDTILVDFPAPEVAADDWSKLYLLPGAPMELVQSAYRVMAKLYHPDVNKATDASERMKAINAAYKHLMGEFASEDKENGK